MVEIRCPLCKSFVTEIMGDKPTTPLQRTYCYARTHEVKFEVKEGKLVHLSASVREKKNATA